MSKGLTSCSPGISTTLTMNLRSTTSCRKKPQTCLRYFYPSFLTLASLVCFFFLFFSPPFSIACWLNLTVRYDPLLLHTFVKIQATFIKHPFNTFSILFAFIGCSCRRVMIYISTIRRTGFFFEYVFSKGFFFLIIIEFFFFSFASVASGLLIRHLNLHSVMPSGHYLTFKISNTVLLTTTWLLFCCFVDVVVCSQHFTRAIVGETHTLHDLSFAWRDIRWIMFNPQILLSHKNKHENCLSCDGATGCGSVCFCINVYVSKKKKQK